VVAYHPVPCRLGVMGETAPFSHDQHLYFAWPGGGWRRVETPECSQIALGHGQRLSADPFALTPPSGARERGFSVRCWLHMPASFLGSSTPTVARARRCQITDAAGAPNTLKDHGT
jgi:hypothetical protein